MTNAVLIAHGQPSDAEPAAKALNALAAKVALHLPGWRVTAATLAEPGAIARATAASPTGRAYPLFMAGGWFTRVQIPTKLAEAGAGGWTVLEPFGCDPALHALAETIVAEALESHGLNPGETTLLLAAHGSFKSPVPSDIARSLVTRIKTALGLHHATAAFIDQTPTLAQTRETGPNTLCLPFFAAEGGHVTIDIPEALTTAGFQGYLLPPLGLDPRTPALIAAALRVGAPICTTECRHRVATGGA